MDKFTPQQYTGTDAPKLRAWDSIEGAPQEALTTADDTAFTTGGANNLKTADADILENMRIRLNELESKFQALGLLK